MDDDEATITLTVRQLTTLEWLLGIGWDTYLSRFCQTDEQYEDVRRDYDPIKQKLNEATPSASCTPPPAPPRSSATRCSPARTRPRSENASNNSEVPEVWKANPLDYALG